MSGEETKSVETKLGELMLQGWTMLAEACFKESCSTPLMRDNVTKQVYCVGCEAWVFTKENKVMQQKFNELVSLEGKRNIQLINHNEVSTIKKPVIQVETSSFRDILETKLISFSGWLHTETDITKCNEILDAMRKTMELLKEVQKKNH